MFDNTTNQNNSLTAVDKFAYLLSCLCGELLNLIKGIPRTFLKYSIAWNKLLGDYQYIRRSVNFHISKIIDATLITVNCLKHIRHFIRHLYWEFANYELLTLSTILLRKLYMSHLKRFEHKRSPWSYCTYCQRIYFIFLHRDNWFRLFFIRPLMLLKLNKYSNKIWTINEIKLQNMFTVWMQHLNLNVLIIRLMNIYKCHNFHNVTNNKRLQFIKNVVSIFEFW